MRRSQDNFWRVATKEVCAIRESVCLLLSYPQRCVVFESLSRDHFAFLMGHLETRLR
jgi:hypothetical protein